VVRNLVHVQTRSRELLEGRVEASWWSGPNPPAVVQRKDCTWNVRGLFAASRILNLPQSRSDGTVELSDSHNPEDNPVAICGTSPQLTPAGKGTISFQETPRETVRDGRLDWFGRLGHGQVELHGDIERIAIGEPLRGRVAGRNTRRLQPSRPHRL